MTIGRWLHDGRSEGQAGIDSVGGVSKLCTA